MAKFRKKPDVIEAWTVRELLRCAAGDWDALPAPVLAAYEFKGPGCGVIFGSDFIHIWTLEGEMRGESDDMVIRGIKGEFYPCKPDIFAATYEAVE